MLGHFLLTLSPDQEDRVLTQAMRLGDYEVDDAAGLGPCLVGTVGLAESRCTAWESMSPGNCICIESRYDDACERFGTARINALLRQRILTNRLWRTLQPAQTVETTHV